MSKDRKTFKDILEEEFPEEKKNNRIFYGSNCNTSGKSINKKTNYICSVKGCGYSARIWVWGIHMNKSYNQSKHCPEHGDTLINVGNACEIPKKGNREELIKMYI